MAIRGVFRSRAYFNTEHKRPNWWLRFASYRAESENEPVTLAELDRIRRSKLTAWALLATFITLVLFGGSAANDIFSGIGVATAGTACLVGVLLNRRGHVNTAGIILVTSIIAAITILFIGWGFREGGVTTDMLPDYDYLAAAVLLAATTLPHRSAYILLAINIVLMLLCWNLLTQAPDLIQMEATYPTPFIAAATLIGRPIGFNILCALLGFSIVQGYNEATFRIYVAMSVVEDRTDLATAMSRTAEEQTMIQHYQDIFFTAITQYVANRGQGIFQTIRLNFPSARTALEEQTQIRVAAEAHRLNTFFHRLDLQEERRMWDLRQYIGTLRHYAHSLSAILRDPEHADISTLHPKRFGTTNDPTMDSLISLVFAITVGAEPWHLLTRSRLRFDNVATYTDQTRANALSMYQSASSTSRGNIVGPPVMVKSKVQNSSAPSQLVTPTYQPSPLNNPSSANLEHQPTGQAYDPRAFQLDTTTFDSDYPPTPFQPTQTQPTNESDWRRGAINIKDNTQWPSLDLPPESNTDQNLDWQQGYDPESRR